MKKCLGFLALVSLFCLTPAHAGSPAAAADAQLQAIFSMPKPILLSTCTATASCPSGTISCGPVTNTGTTTCVGVDHNCNNLERGYVQCGATRIDCPDLCADPCRNYNRQYPGCNYTWSVPGQCCTTQNVSCPAVNFCQ